MVKVDLESIVFANPETGKELVVITSSFFLSLRQGLSINCRDFVPVSINPSYDYVAFGKTKDKKMDVMNSFINQYFFRLLIGSLVVSFFVQWASINSLTKNWLRSFLIAAAAFGSMVLAFALMTQTLSGGMGDALFKAGVFTVQNVAFFFLPAAVFVLIEFVLLKRIFEPLLHPVRVFCSILLAGSLVALSFELWCFLAAGVGG